MPSSLDCPVSSSLSPSISLVLATPISTPPPSPTLPSTSRARSGTPPNAASLAYALALARHSPTLPPSLALRVPSACNARNIPMGTEGRANVHSEPVFVGPPATSPHRTHAAAQMHLALPPMMRCGPQARPKARPSPPLPPAAVPASRAVTFNIEVVSMEALEVDRHQPYIGTSPNASQQVPETPFKFSFARSSGVFQQRVKAALPARHAPVSRACSFGENMRAVDCSMPSLDGQAAFIQSGQPANREHGERDFAYVFGRR